MSRHDDTVKLFAEEEDARHGVHQRSPVTSKQTKDRELTGVVGSATGEAAADSKQEDDAPSRASVIGSMALNFTSAVGIIWTNKYDLFLQEHTKKNTKIGGLCSTVSSGLPS